MTWNTIKERLKSPVVVWQIILIVGATIVAFVPSLADSWKIVAGAIAAVFSLFSGLNNPSDKESF